MSGDFSNIVRRPTGIVLIVLGLMALAAPIVVGSWSIRLLGLPLVLIALREFYHSIPRARQQSRSGGFVTGLLALAAGLLLFASPSLVVSGLVIMLIVVLVVDGVQKLLRAFRGPATGTRTMLALNGAVSIATAVLAWLLWKTFDVNVAIGIAVGCFIITSGWSALLSPPQVTVAPQAVSPMNEHPDIKLGLGAQPLFRRMRRNATRRQLVSRYVELGWLAVAVAVLFVIHAVRMNTSDSWLGLVSPVVATGGDFLMTAVLGALILLPVRLTWRWLTRPFERYIWRRRIDGNSGDLGPLLQTLAEKWSNARYSFALRLQAARSSLLSAGALVLRLGLPIAVIFVAVNPIWGFTWYFNTESWASGVYQKITELRVDRWRSAMIQAVALEGGEDTDQLFQIKPPGTAVQDFSFIVIGDPGEGDPSQLALTQRFVELGQRSDIKFMVISSDIIYPAGAMVDYERNFYLPFKGFEKPIYAIPGNHDWFDALEGFNANFLVPDAARTALQARTAADHGLTSTNQQRIERYIAEAARLRDLYRIDNANQHGPFFELQTPAFALLAIDTGILRTIDDEQRAWLLRALARSEGKTIMAILGHPKFAGGRDTSIGDARFFELLELLNRHRVSIVMAGDTHDFEYYSEPVQQGDPDQVTHHFVNGGGGAYLSIGTALDWPHSPATETWAYYPATPAVSRKLDTETPLWKQPVWQWIKRYRGWPLTTETLSGIFDFNRAPFFQSLVEVRVEGSRNRIVLALHGVDGPLKWRDVQLSASQETDAPDAAVEFSIPLMTPVN